MKVNWIIFNSAGWFNLLGLWYRLCPLNGSGPWNTQESKQHVYVVYHKFGKALSIYFLIRSSLISNIKIQLRGGVNCTLDESVSIKLYLHLRSEPNLCLLLKHRLLSFRKVVFVIVIVLQSAVIPSTVRFFIFLVKTGNFYCHFLFFSLTPQVQQTPFLFVYLLLIW